MPWNESYGILYNQLVDITEQNRQKTSKNDGKETASSEKTERQKTDKSENDRHSKDGL